jgi:hypothetical protein
MCLTTGTDSAMASTLLSGLSTFANGVRTPAASQTSFCCLRHHFSSRIERLAGASGD